MKQGLNRRVRSLLAKVNWWAASIIVLQLIVLYRIEEVHEEAADASSQAYDAYIQAQIAAEASEATKDKLQAY